jgi:hypothetical protein
MNATGTTTNSPSSPMQRTDIITAAKKELTG